ncbi:MAG: hypothetical protein IPF41_16975 [Flavobacteriales bacterium]|nr:hypothetical protein [Flavobacteriales bacterium]
MAPVRNWSTSLTGTANTSTLPFHQRQPGKVVDQRPDLPMDSDRCTAARRHGQCGGRLRDGHLYDPGERVQRPSAPNVTIQSPTGTNVHANVGTGTYSIGPIAFGTARTVTVVHNGNTACNLSLGSFNYTNAAGVCHGAAVYPIADNGCGVNNYTSVPLCVSSPGTALGTDVFVRSVDLIASHTWGR